MTEREIRSAITTIARVLSYKYLWLKEADRAMITFYFIELANRKFEYNSVSQLATRDRKLYRIALALYIEHRDHIITLTNYNTHVHCFEKSSF